MTEIEQAFQKLAEKMKVKIKFEIPVSKEEGNEQAKNIQSTIKDKIPAPAGAIK